MALQSIFPILPFFSNHFVYSLLSWFGRAKKQPEKSPEKREKQNEKKSKNNPKKPETSPKTAKNEAKPINSQK
jgi:hypothetical protein